MSKPTLSVCLITYNQAQYVKEAIDSILMQKVNFAWELIIADDNSTDGTRQILLEYKKKHPDLIKLILQKGNVGAEKNWLDLISHPRSKYIAYLEGDDYWTDPNKLQLQVDFLENNPLYSLCFHPTKVFFEGGEGKQTVWPKLSADSELSVGELLKENFIPSNSVVYRRQSYTNLSTGIMPGDWYFHLYHAQFGRIGLINRVMSVYRRHSGGMWWGSFNDHSEHWAKHGLSMLALYSEFMKMFGNNEEYGLTISKAAAAVLDRLVEADQVKGKNLIATALQDLPGITKSGLIYMQQKQHELSKALQNKSEEIEALTLEVLDLRRTVFMLQDELQALKNARLLGKIIRFRNFIGSLRREVVHFPRLVLHQIRVVIAPFFPAPIRRSLKWTYKMARSKLHKSSRARPVTTNIVRNKRWNEKSPLVSVVIPYYNRGDTIDDTINSLKSQTFQDFETIIIDDGSIDEESVKKLEWVEKNKVDVHVIRQKNQGVAAARNNGITEAKGRYIICLDSDDMLEDTFIEKCTVVLESSPDTALVTSHQEMFGVLKEAHKNSQYNPLKLFRDNMVITAAEFRREAWEDSGGYKSGMGYEDWEYWINLSEHGFWGKLIPEELFKYRTSMQSRYVDDKDVHWNNLKVIRALHPKYKKNINKLLAKRVGAKNIVEVSTAFINMGGTNSFLQAVNERPSILITIPWMTFGGAETLIYNYCREIKEDFNITFVTGLKSDHEWEYKFKEITPYIYHLANLFEDEALYIEFISNYIKTRNIDILHIIHNGFTFKMLPVIRRLHPNLKIVVTMFNDRVEYFEQSIGVQQYLDAFITDNAGVAKHYTQKLEPGKTVSVLPNGINCYEEYNPNLFDRTVERHALGLKEEDMAVFFVGRLSVEKNPDVFAKVAKQMLVSDRTANIKFFIIGDGPMRPEIEKAVKDVKGGITYLGYQPEVAKYLSAADVFVLPSSIEGFPLSILEAMAMNVAVIASNVGAVADVIDSGAEGFVVSPGSVTEIVDALRKLRDQPELLKSMKTKAREKVEKNYSNRILGKNYKEEYGKLAP